jgi:hypothetical protein
MAAFIPGASPPLVKTAIFFMDFVLLGDPSQNYIFFPCTAVI